MCCSRLSIEPPGSTGLRHLHWIGRRLKLRLALLCLGGAAVVAFVYPLLVTPAILCAVGMLILDWIELTEEIRSLTTVITDNRPEQKLEVATGVWGELAHALNRLLQEQRTEQQIRTLLPALPLAGALRLIDRQPPTEGWVCDIGVVAVELPGFNEHAQPTLHSLAHNALYHAQLHDALLSRTGSTLLIITGILNPNNPSQILRSSYQIAEALNNHALHEERAGPAMSLTLGSARAMLLPGLGLSVAGEPIDEAESILKLSAPGQLICSEAAYLGLRRMGTPLARIAAPFNENTPPAYQIKL
ncbi:hypothetical protein EYB53_004535 [Candidatus Chloroploca sp. M-50]|uniref:Uncharacterized protein n=1 Tax=Candidatus Chloroploca mongolica TaxID=2528176 RepID=A0ABS4D6B5_9CHLR|nr:hypothetical protein [Candidatus Chloroploca mongolica]MBP1464971.1 hypothetical protein [Candidatus Chloroploca mongolica]